MKRLLLVLWMLLAGWAAAQSPEPAAKPHPVLCQVTVHVVEAGSGEPVGGVAVAMLTSRLTTAADGTAVFHQVPNHPMLVLVGTGTDARRLTVVPNPQHPVDVTVAVRAFVDEVISAVTERDNRGVPGATVMIDDHLAGTTDDRGLLSVRLPAGTHRFRLSHSAYLFVPSVLSVVVRLTDTDGPSFVGRPITGRVRVRVMSHGAPVVGASVTILQDSADNAPLLLTGADGTVLTDPLVVGRYLIKVQASGLTFPPEPRAVVLSAPGEVWVTVQGVPNGSP